MPEIDVSGGFECGGFHWRVDSTPEGGRECLKNSHLGECAADDQTITIDTHWSPESVSETIIHEMLEAVKHIYLDGNLKHRDLTLIANGLHQVMESLGVRFVVAPTKDISSLDLSTNACTIHVKGNGHGEAIVGVATASAGEVAGVCAPA